MLTTEQLQAYGSDGFVVLRGFLEPAAAAAMADECIAAIRADPPAAHPGEPAYATANGLFVQPEAKPMEAAMNPEDQVSKLFNPHLAGACAAFARDARLAPMVGQLLGAADADVFQSMFILKNAGAWGQPWHQDSFYFDFDPQPQLGAWLAISPATLTNGCLWVLPGSHRDPIAAHAPDKRPGANQGYLEIVGLDDRAAVPMTMAPGDLLLFHSFLKHRSSDNTDGQRRAAMVLHYAPAGVRNLAPSEITRRQAAINIFRPALRAGVPV